MPLLAFTCPACTLVFFLRNGVSSASGIFACPSCRKVTSRTPGEDVQTRAVHEGREG